MEYLKNKQAWKIIANIKNVNITNINRAAHLALINHSVGVS